MIARGTITGWKDYLIKVGTSTLSSTNIACLWTNPLVLCVTDDEEACAVRDEVPSISSTSKEFEGVYALTVTDDYALKLQEDCSRKK